MASDRGHRAVPKKPTPDTIEMHIGQRIRLRRMMLSMTQEDLGAQLGVTFQQVQRYEKGKKLIGASLLQAIAKVLLVPVSWFFEDAPT